MGIKEIAELANVSKTTVSLALNGHKGVSHQTRMKIAKLAKDMGYRVPGERTISHPSRGFIMFARLYKHGKILNTDQHSFIMDYIDGMNRMVRDSGYTFEIFDHHLKTIEFFINEVIDRKPSGVIILGTELEASDVSVLQSLPIPHIVIDTYFEEVATDYVDMANIGAVYDVVEHFIQTGHKNLCMVSSNIKSGNVVMRERGFLLALQHFNVAIPKPCVIEVSPGFNGSHYDMKEYLDQHDISDIEGLFCYNDIAAFGVIKALRERGIKAPRDISIIGFDDLPMSSMMEPHLTTVRVPNRQIGSIAAKSLIERLTSKKLHDPVGLLVSGSLIIRESVRDIRHSKEDTL